MPVIPTFNSYAPKPDLANAYLGAQRIALGRQELQQRAAQAAAQLQTQREIAELEHNARMQAQMQDSLVKQQQLEQQRAYQQAMLGLEQMQAQYNLSHQALLQKQYEDRVIGQENLRKALAPDSGMTEREAILRFGPAAGVESGYYSGGLYDPAKTGARFAAPNLTNVEGHTFAQDQEGGPFHHIASPPSTKPDIAQRMAWFSQLQDARKQAAELRAEIKKLEAVGITDKFEPRKGSKLQQSQKDVYLQKRRDLEEKYREIKALQDAVGDMAIQAPTGPGDTSTSTSTNSRPRVISIETE